MIIIDMDSHGAVSVTDEAGFLADRGELPHVRLLASVKKDERVPKVGDTVVLNDEGLMQIFGRTQGLAHMKSLRMKITHVDDTGMTCPGPTFFVEVDNKDVNAYLIDHLCFDIVEHA